MVLLFLLSTTICLLNIFYVHGYGILKTLGLLFQVNSKKNQENAKEKNGELMQMLLYWIVFVISSFLCCIPLIPTVRTLFLSAMLSPKVDLKKILNDFLFNGEVPQFEHYMGSFKVISNQIFNYLKTVEE